MCRKMAKGGRKRNSEAGLTRAAEVAAAAATVSEGGGEGTESDEAATPFIPPTPEPEKKRDLPSISLHHE